MTSKQRLATVEPKSEWKVCEALAVAQNDGAIWIIVQYPF
jgi:hypothetical protein